jgi:hypothetical protein
MARISSASNHLPIAIDSLKHAVASGFSAKEDAMYSPDLKAIRTDPRMEKQFHKLFSDKSERR